MILSRGLQSVKPPASARRQTTNSVGPSKQDYTVRNTRTDGTEILYLGIMQPAVNRIGISGFVATIRIASDTYQRAAKEE